MKEINYGGPAFPVFTVGRDTPYMDSGMSLRTYIATKAMCALMANSEDGVCTIEAHMTSVAERGVMAADALIAALRES